VIEHLDEDGQPCAYHPPATPESVLALAILGARMPTLHHDAASKMQSLMMALDEINELVGDGAPELRAAADTAYTAMRELQQLLAQNRAMARPPPATRTALVELVRLAAERFGVKVRGDVPAIDVAVAPASAIHAVGALLDLAAGPANLGRVVDLTIASVERFAVMSLAGPPKAVARQPANASATIAIATFAIGRDGGAVCCAGDGARLVVKLPLAST
jgi:hypothetical protein